MIFGKRKRFSIGWINLLLLCAAIYIFLWGYNGYVSIVYPALGMILGPLYVWFEQGWLRAAGFTMLHSWVLGAFLFHGTYKFAAPLIATVLNLISRIKMMFGYGFLFFDNVIKN